LLECDKKLKCYCKIVSNDILYSSKDIMGIPVSLRFFEKREDVTGELK